MRIKEALYRMITENVKDNKVITLTKIKHTTGKHVLTIGSGLGEAAKYNYAIYDYHKGCKSGELAIKSNDAYRLAEYLIEFCGREFLKSNLPTLS